MSTSIPVMFRFPGSLAPQAQVVALVGAFNAWTPHTHPLTKTPEGDWIITVYLHPGRAVYCFHVDGVAWLDPNDDGRVPNGWGSEYSIRYVLFEPASSRPG